MKRISGLILIGALSLAGCASTPEETAPPAAVEQATTFENIATMEDALAHVRTISAETTDLANEISGTARAMGDLVVEEDLPWDVNNKIGQDLISLNSEALNDPSNASTLIGELNRIADNIEDAM